MEPAVERVTSRFAMTRRIYSARRASLARHTPMSFIEQGKRNGVKACDGDARYLFARWQGVYSLADVRKMMQPSHLC